MKQDQLLMYGALAAAGYYLYSKKRAEDAAAAANNALTVPTDPSYVIPNTSSGAPVLSTPVPNAAQYIAPPVAPITGNYVTTPWGNVTPSNFGPSGANSNGSSVVTPPNSVGPLSVSLGKVSGYNAPPTWVLLETLVSGSRDGSYVFTYTFPEAVNSAQGIKSGVAKEWQKGSTNKDRIWYSVEGLSLPRVINVSVYSDPAHGGDGKTGTASYTLTGV
jgi:hypothetical protein